MDINNVVMTEILFAFSFRFDIKCISETYLTVNNAIREVGKANIMYHYLRSYSRSFLLVISMLKESLVISEYKF